MRILAQSGIALVVVMTASLVVATATPAEACTCEAERRLSADFSEMESVFTGKVIKIEPKAGDAAHNLVTISVFQPFRDDQNVLQGNVQVVTPASDAACGVRFKLDQAYLVYASRESAGDGAQMVVSSCSPPLKVSRSREAIACLKALKAGTTSLYAGACLTPSDVRTLSNSYTEVERRAPEFVSMVNYVWHTCRDKNPDATATYKISVTADPDKGSYVSAVRQFTQGAWSGTALKKGDPLLDCLSERIKVRARSYLVFREFNANFFLPIPQRNF